MLKTLKKPPSGKKRKKLLEEKRKSCRITGRVLKARRKLFALSTQTSGRDSEEGKNRSPAD